MLEPDIQLVVVDPEVLRQLEKRISRIERHLDDEPTLVYDGVRIRDRSGRYVIEERLAQGGMAELFVARTSVTGIAKRVVLKTLLPRFVDDATFVAMLFNEARIVGNLCHPNIVRVEDLIELDRRPYIVMEYLEGVNLRQMLGRAARSDCAPAAGIACHIVGKVLAALGHAHDRQDDAGRPLGLVHRDLSLANVMVTWSGRVKLIDFGIAKETLVATERTRAGELKGKCSYMSPEQVRCQPLDGRSDLFAAGIVLWELLTGSRLFWRDNELDTLSAVCAADVEPPSSLVPGVPKRLDRICKKALAGAREQRYASADAMRADLDELMVAQGWASSAAALRNLLASLF